MVNMKIVRYVPEAIYHNLNLLGADIPGLSEYTQNVEVCLTDLGKEPGHNTSLFRITSLFDNHGGSHLVVVDVNIHDTNFASFTLEHTKDLYASILNVVLYALVGPGAADLQTELHEIREEGEKAILSAKGFAGAWDDLVHYTRLLKYEMDKGD